MKKYIDLEELKTAIRKRFECIPDRCEINTVVNSMPTFEIVQCKDCYWWEKQEDSPQGRCDLMQMYPTGGWYCANGRRRKTND